ncbi:alpha-2-macroglobulin family protein [Flavobacterium cerinum]|uniref:Alpha-2-macroglobulin domain-containing protein n=1 Tax=Flavobacterium cerinum TaxID=2502784 RepID=A0A3S3U1Z1_9FLAO|nr:alpha-2-macroglobulin family protein [Flavobacterium cerinum]RWX02291.1 hypothetical protein EPI11_03480 [Flavobacterium cerinum]
MKKILLLIIWFVTTSAFCQNYEKQWAEVIEFEANGEIKKAAALTDVIYTKAQRDKNESQLIKTFFFKSKYMQRVEEDAQFKIITTIQEDIKKASLPAKAILNSIYAQLLEKIYTKNAMRIGSVKTVKDYSRNDYRQWSPEIFKKEIDIAYTESLNNPEILYNIPLTDFDAIIDFVSTLRNSKRPLYDFLAEQYLDYLWNNADVGYHSYFTKNTSSLFGNTEAFLALKKNDSLIYEATKGLKLLSEIENHFYVSNDKPNLERATLRRLNYMDEEIHSYEKNSYYLNTIEQLVQNKEKTPFTYNAKLIQAKLLVRLADKKLFSNNLVKAVTICDEIINDRKNNSLAPEALSLKSSLVNKVVSIKLENYITPNSPSLALVNFQNTDSINVSFYKVPRNVNERDSNFKDAYITNKKPTVTKTYILPNKHDHFNYTTEIILPSLSQGTYAVMTTSTRELLSELNITKIQVSQITLVEEQRNESHIYQIVDRDSGKPIENVNVFESVKKQLKTNKEGKITFIKTEDQKNYNNITFIHQGDTITEGYYFSTISKMEDLRAMVHVYLDRHLYRPGQTVYFKAIAIQDYKGSISVVPNTYFTISVENEQGDEIKKFRLKTNEYGSFTEKIELPKNMVGRFTINIEEDEEDSKNEKTFWDEADFDTYRTNFIVEEYKRPTFEVTFDKIKSELRLNKVISVKGFANTFANVSISNAKVVYRVERTAKKYWYEYYGKDTQLTKGETTTNGNGQFTIQFNAEPDDAYDPDTQPIFTYTIYVDVTDVSGETHSNTYSVNAGYHALIVSAKMPDIINIHEKTIVALETNNLNGEFLPASGSIDIYKIAAHDNFYIKRPWTEPEIQTITKKEFKQNFPHLPYKTLKDSVIKQTILLSRIVNTGQNKQVVFNDFKNWTAGEYELVFTAKDSLGNDVTSNTRFTLKNNEDKIPADKKLFDYEITNTDYAKDGYVEIEISSGLQLYISATASCDNMILYDKLLELNAEKKKIRVPVLKSPRTPMYFLISYVWQNKYYSKQFNLLIPQKKEIISFETETLTSKLLPGSNQTWSFSIKGSKKPLEVLASMYDASLDKLVIEDSYGLNTWNYPDIHNYYGGGNLYRSFLNNYPSITSFDEVIKKVMLSKSNDTFYMYGFDFDNASNSYFAYTPKTQLASQGDFIVNGIVTDTAGMPIPGVNVTIDGTNEGIQTDFDGKYSIYTTLGEKIVFSYISMKPRTVTITGNEDLDIKLQDDTLLLQDVVVEGYRNTTRATSNIAVTTVTSKTIEGRPNANFIQTLQGQVPGLNIETGAGTPGAADSVTLRGAPSLNGNSSPLYIIDGVPLSENDFKNLTDDEIIDLVILKDKDQIAAYGPRGANGVVLITTKKGIEGLQQVKARKNFNETAFFYPQLTTDRKGKLSFSFTTPEALTQWKLRLFAHNKNAAAGYSENTFFTQKDLMISPNMPRFLREKDTITLIAKISNLTSEIKTGNAMLQLFDAITMEPVDAQMLNAQNVKSFTIPSKGNSTVSWTIAIPKGMQAVQYKVLAKAGDFTDGEENILPVLTNNILVTESIPLWVKSNTRKEYTFDNLKQNTSTTLLHQGITLEYTSNPVWLALQSLPYLMEYEHECAEQVFSRYYANAIATHVLNSNPKIAEIFAAWHKEGKPLSKLEENKELKALLIAESPWLMDAQSDEEKKNRVALLFNLDIMEGELQTNFKKIEKKQSPSGGFSWFEGGNDSEYITRHIIAGFGHLQKLGINSNDNKNTEYLIKKAIQFIDTKFLEQHKKRMAHAAKNREVRMELSNDQLHYLYARSFFNTKYPLADSIQKTIKKHIETVIDNKAWLNYSLYEKGMAALLLHRFNETPTAKKILTNLKETSANNDEWGMYWIENKPGWRWYQSPIETQALLIEAFTEIDNDVQSADAMKVWLLKNKQNKNWPTTKATTEAVYALLMQGTQWLSIKDNTIIKLGGANVLNKKLLENEKEAGTGYIKLEWKPEEVNTGMATLQIENKTAVPGYGGFYWQYFEDLDKIQPSQKSIMNVQKELYIKTNTAKGIELLSITKDKPLKIGDIVTVRLIISNSEDLEYVHLKDMRASAFEPSDVVSGYKRTSGISYYQSTRDAATHFFFDDIERGTYILEYDVKVNNAGEFSNGITTIQSMYAPEFSAHSKSIQVTVKQ